MNDNKLKEMWSKAEELSKVTGYESQKIEQFISGRSNSIIRKMKNMIRLDIGLKVLVALIFVIDALLYADTFMVLALSCFGAVTLIPLIFYEMNILKQFRQAADSGRTIKKQLVSLLTFLRTRFSMALVSMASTYIFVFISGMLIYFYLTYGYVRPLDLMDIFVFATFIFLGIALNYAVNRNQVKYHIKHLELCLSDLNDNILKVASQNIEFQQKQDRILKFLLAMVVILGFVLLIAVLKSAGL